MNATLRRTFHISVLVVNSLAFMAALVIAPAPRSPVSAQSGPTPTATPARTTKLRALLKGSTTNSTDPNGNTSAEVKLPKDGAPWAGSAYELVQSDDHQFNWRFRFSRIDSDVQNRTLVYDHVENNKPFCPFGDDNGQCRPLPLRDGIPWWPDSDAGPGRPMQPGRYVLEVNSVQKTKGEGGNWQRTVDSDNAIYFTIEFQQIAEAPPIQLPPLTGKATITSPRDGAVLKGVVNIRGAATANNFAYYKFEFEDARCEKGVCFVADAKRSIANGVLMRWDTRTVPNGTYLMHLVVVDKWGRELPQVPRIQVTIQN